MRPTADVVDPEQVEAFVERTISVLGRIDLFVANAGVPGAAGSRRPTTYGGRPGTST